MIIDLDQNYNFHLDEEIKYLSSKISGFEDMNDFVLHGLQSCLFPMSRHEKIEWTFGDIILKCTANSIGNVVFHINTPSTAMCILEHSSFASLILKMYGFVAIDDMEYMRKKIRDFFPGFPTKYENFIDCYEKDQWQNDEYSIIREKKKSGSVNYIFSKGKDVFETNPQHRDFHDEFENVKTAFHAFCLHGKITCPNPQRLLDYKNPRMSLK